MFKVLVAMSILVAIPVAVSYAPLPTPPGAVSAWRDACNLSGYSCRGITRPVVALTPLPNLYGRYRMGDVYILVNEDLPANLAYAVAVHEMVHYLQYRHGKWKFTKENSCVMEHEAFDVSNIVLKRLGLDKEIVDWNKTRIWYGCAA